MSSLLEILGFKPAPSIKPQEPLGSDGLPTENPQLSQSLPSPPPAWQQLEELRVLLLGKEQAEIRSLKDRVSQIEDQGVSADQMANLLPESVQIRAKQDERLVQSITPVMEDAIRESIRQNRFKLADILFPAIGPAIRRAIAQALRTITDTNRPEHEQYRSLLSWPGLQMRFEAFKTGRSFDEVLLSRMLVYRVEQVFLIHKESGLLLQQASTLPANENADLISGMLTAINSFVEDSFGHREALDTLEMGDLTVMIEEGPMAVLAGVIRGHAPESLRETFQETLENIHFEQQLAFRSFQGDTAIFTPSQPYLARCLEASYRKSDQSVSPAVLELGFKALAILLVVGGIAFYIGKDWIRWNKFTDLVRRTPGYALMEEKRDWYTFTGWGKYYLQGLKDPNAQDLTGIMHAAGFGEDRVIAKWEAFQSLNPKILERRLAKKLNLPERVRLRIDPNGVARFSGVALAGWADALAPLVLTTDGVSGFDISAVYSPELALQQDVLPRTQSTTILYPFEQATPSVGDLNLLAVHLKEAFALAEMANKPLSFVLKGHTDGANDSYNQKLSQERADYVKNWLVKNQALPADKLQPLGVASRDPIKVEGDAKQIEQANRCVTIHPIFGN